MRLNETKIGEVLVLRLLESALDAHVAGPFRDRLSELVQGGHERIVLDLSAVDFMDSTGLGAVVTGLKCMRGHGQLALCGIQEPVLNVFRLTRMDRVFTITDDAPSAAAALDGTAAQPGGGTVAR